MPQPYASSFLFKLYSVVIFLLLISYGLRNANANANANANTNEDADGVPCTQLIRRQTCEYGDEVDIRYCRQCCSKDGKPFGRCNTENQCMCYSMNPNPIEYEYEESTGPSSHDDVDDSIIGDLFVGGSGVGSYRRGGNYDHNENDDEEGNEYSQGDDEVSSSSNSDDDGTGFRYDNVVGWRVVQRYGRRYVVPVNDDVESTIANFWWTEIYRNEIPYMFPSDFEEYANTNIDFDDEDDDSDEVSSTDSMDSANTGFSTDNDDNNDENFD